jgi:hypothetical protein
VGTPLCLRDQLKMEQIIRDRGAGPWFYAVSDGAFREFTV